MAVKFSPCKDCECLFCFKSFDCGNGCTNPLRCSVENKPASHLLNKSDKWDYRTRKIILAAKQICPQYLTDHGIYNLLLRKDHIQLNGIPCKKEKRSLLNMELDHLAKTFDEMHQNGKISINWRKL